MADRFLIAPYDKQSGLQTNYKPFLIPDLAFSTLNNAYVYRGRVRKRFGTLWLSNLQQGTRLRIALPTSLALPGGVNVGVTTAGGNATGIVGGGVVGQRFSIGAAVYQIDNPAAGVQAMSQSIPTTTATYNLTTGAYNFVGAPANQQIYFYNGTQATTNGIGTIDVRAVGNSFGIGQAFSIGTELFTVTALGTPSALLRSTGSLAVAEFNTTTGDVHILGAALNTAIYFYPGLPVMGLLSFDSAQINNEPTIAFDTRYAYRYVGSGWERLPNEFAAGDAQWNGTDSQFFWSVTWVGDNGADKIFFVTNFNENEPNNMRYLDANIWHTYKPLIQVLNVPAPIYMFSARILVVFHNHLIAINTWEGADADKPGTNYQNRIRWTWTFSPLNAEAWRQDLAGRGGGLDASTTESVIGAEFIQDRLIIYFERSAWELVWTGNSVQPFALQQINTELGVESTFSVIPFDKIALGIANVGVHACNGLGVERIDEIIPDVIFKISNVNNGPERTYGIRDYKTEVVYWSYPDISLPPTNVYPNKVLVYNYQNNTWGMNDDTITCFGYFQSQTGILWDSTTVTWDMDIGWDDGSAAARFRAVIGGNQQGWTFYIDPDVPTSAGVLQISDIAVVGNVITLTVVNHQFLTDNYIYLANITGTGTIATGLNDKIFQILSTTANTIVINNEPEAPVAGTYTGMGTIARVSNIQIVTKQYNFYLDKAQNCSINKIDFQVKRSEAGKVAIQLRTNSGTTDLTAGAAASGALLGTGTLVTSPYPLYPYEQTAERLMHPFYTSVNGEFVELTITLTDDLMRDVNVMRSDFQLHSMMFYSTPSSRLQ